MPFNPNREYYNRDYSEENMILRPRTSYDRKMIDFRFSLIEKYGYGREVLDLCCGSGSYLIPVLPKLRRAIGIDFSSTMLEIFQRNIAERSSPHLILAGGDAAALPLKSRSVDFVFSYSSLYYVPNIGQAINEVGRVLRPGGYAALELGNLNSLNTLVCNVQHRDSGWAKSFHIPFAEMIRHLEDAGLVIKERHSFQLLPMYGAPLRLFFLWPGLTSLWKHIMGIRTGGRLLDEWISGAWPLRHAAFRHLFICQRG